jgi:hypothetical protein
MASVKHYRIAVLWRGDREGRRTATPAEIRQPLGYAIVGGLIRQPGADALYDADCLLYLDRLNAWLTGASRARRPGWRADCPICESTRLPSGARAIDGSRIRRLHCAKA